MLHTGAQAQRHTYELTANDTIHLLCENSEVKEETAVALCVACYIWTIGELPIPLVVCSFVRWFCVVRAAQGK